MMANTGRAQERGLVHRPLEDTIRDTLPFAQKMAAEIDADQPFGISRERERELLTAWKEQISQ
jgi:hypothetical protein